jgi:histidyl-tRNA synthetase
MASAPVISEYICDDCRRHFVDVQKLLEGLGIDFTLEPRLVRGLDYYSRTTFEFKADGLGTQDTVLGGGRYDGLAETLGGPPLPAIGFSAGVDRVLLAGGDSQDRSPSPVAVYVVAVGDEARAQALSLATRLRRAGVGADLDLLGRGLKGQMKDADRSGARWAAILGDEELAAGMVTLKDLESGGQETISVERLEDRVSP